MLSGAGNLTVTNNGIERADTVILPRAANDVEYRYPRGPFFKVDNSYLPYGSREFCNKTRRGIYFWGTLTAIGSLMGIDVNLFFATMFLLGVDITVNNRHLLSDVSPWPNGVAVLFGGLFTLMTGTMMTARINEWNTYCRSDSTTESGSAPVTPASSGTSSTSATSDTGQIAMASSDEIGFASHRTGSSVYAGVPAVPGTDILIIGTTSRNALPVVAGRPATTPVGIGR